MVTTPSHPEPEGWRDRGFIDIPAMWWLHDQITEHLDPRCSALPGWSPISGGGLLCDCGAIQAEW